MLLPRARRIRGGCRVCVIAKRAKVARAIADHDLTEIVLGRLDDHQYYIGCSPPRCCMCSPHKHLPNGDRQRADEVWRPLEEAA